MVNSNDMVYRKAYIEAGRMLALYLLFHLSLYPPEDIPAFLKLCRGYFAGLSIDNERTDWRNVAEYWRLTHAIFLGGCAADRIRQKITDTPSLSDVEFEKSYYAQQWFWVDLDHNPSPEQVFAETREGLSEATERLEKHWNVVEILAGTLLKRRELSAEEALQIISKNIDAQKVTVEREARFPRTFGPDKDVVTKPVGLLPKEKLNYEIIQEMDLEFSHFQCCKGNADPYPFKCSVCGQVMVFCYECDTLYPDLMNTNVMKLHIGQFYCPKCNHQFEYDLHDKPNYQVTPSEWMNAGYEYLLTESAKVQKLPPRYPCPCCGYIVFHEPAGSYEICPICSWIDDLSQLRFVHTMGANHVSLVEAQHNYLAIKASEERVKSLVRLARLNEQRDPGWRLIDPALDNIEEPISGQTYGATYPKKKDALYYWRPNYWRRKA
jgi:hypothetical protein